MYLNNNCRKSDPHKRLSRWKMGMALLPIVWTDLLKAFIHRGGLFVVDMVSPLILRLIHMYIFSKRMMHLEKNCIIITNKSISGKGICAEVYLPFLSSSLCLFFCRMDNMQQCRPLTPLPDFHLYDKSHQLFIRDLFTVHF